MRARLVTLAGVMAVATATAAEPGFPFVEDFNAGADQRWTVMAGEWDFGDGQVGQASADYDCGMGVAVKPDQPFYLAIQFKPTGSFNGAGVFFGLPQVDKKHGGTMVRCDPGGRVIYGEFSAAGEFEFGGEFQIPDKQGPQQLAVAVDPAKMSFNVYFDGKRVATGVPTTSVDGYVGIQTSGGPHEFAKVELRPASADELSGLKAPGAMSHMRNIIGDRQRVIILRDAPKFLAVYGGDGQEIGSVSAGDIRGVSGKLDVVDLNWSQASRRGQDQGVLLLAEGGKAIYELDAKLQQVGDGPLLRMPEMAGVAVAADPEGRIFVVDHALKGVRMFAATGEPLGTFGREWEKGDPGLDYANPNGRAAGLFKQPVDIATNYDGLIVITDRTNFTYHAYRFDEEARTLRWVTNGPWLPNPEGVAFNRSGQLILAHQFEFYRSYGAMRVLQLDGRSVNVYCGFALEDMSEKVRACQGPGGGYYIIDPKKDRVVALPEHFVEKLPAFDYLDDGGVKLTLTRTDGTKMTSTHHEVSAEHDGRIAITPPESPATVWPPDEAVQLRTYYLPPKPPAGKMYVIDMPVLVAVFMEGKNEKGETFTVDADPAAVKQRMEDEMVMDRTFYWHNSHAMLNKQFEVMVIDEVVAPIDGPWISPSEGRRVVNEVRKLRGLPEIDSDHSLVCIHPMNSKFDTEVRDDIGYVGGGGLTPYAYSGYALWNHGQGWLMGHEWGHQLDSYFERSGMPAWWLNHPDGTVHVGRYGEHWDCNAFLCRRADPMNWLRFRYGTLRLVDDADGDGLVDDDPTVPMDEARFASLPNKVDSDLDGLTDLQELTAGTFTSSNPRQRNSDGDGKPDGQDPHPQYWLEPQIEPFAPMPGDPAPDELFTKIGTIENKWAHADVYAAYDADTIYFCVAFRKPADMVHVTMDFNNDGWFIGRDNVYATVNVAWQDGAPAVTRSRNCENAVVAKGTTHPAISFAVKRPETRLPLRMGSSVGMTIRLTKGGGTAAFLIDPWQILAVELE